MSVSAHFGQLDDASVRYPYGLYETLRQRPPVWIEEIEAYAVSRFADVREVLQDAETFSSRTVQGPVPLRRMRDVLGTIAAEDPELGERLREGVLMRPVLLASDGEPHDRCRSLVNKAFTSRRISAMEPQIRAIADRLVDSFIERGEVELVTEFAARLPLQVIAGAIGVPADDIDDFRRWSDDIFAPLGVNVPTKPMMEALVRSSHQFMEYFGERIEERRRAPADDILSDLVRAEEDGRRLTRTETLVICSELLAAGNETTTNLISRLVLTLAQRPELARAARADPGQIPALVEEMLRLDGPIQGFYRTATADATVGGTAIPAGSHLFLIYASGNRDAAQFDDPDAIDLSRANARAHLAFGRGAHACLGSLLARTEARIAMEVLLSRLTDIRLDGPAEGLRYIPSYVARGLLALPLRFGA